MAEAKEPDSTATTRGDSTPGSGARRPTVPATAGQSRPVPGPRSRSTPARGRTSPPRAYGNGRPGTPAELRQEIERTRARMTGTLDALEARIAYERRELDRKTQKVVDRVTLKRLRRKLRKEPWRSIAIAFAAGYIVAAIRD